MPETSTKPQNGDGVNSSNDSSKQQAGLSPFVCACFTLNYLIGTGFLALPWAFHRAGILLSAIGMFAICLVANTASDYILTTMARAEAIRVRLKETLASETRAAPKDTRGVPPNEKTSLLESTDDGGGSTNIEEAWEKDGQEAAQTTVVAMRKVEERTTHDTGKEEELLIVGQRKYDLPELCEYFLGDIGMMAYGIAVTLDIYGFLWAYSSVFANAMASALPIFGPERDCYPFYILLFALIVVPMSLLELSEQSEVQVILSACRIAMVLFMIITPLAATLLVGMDETSIPHFDHQRQPEGAGGLVHVSNTHQMLPIVVFAVLFHQAVPGLADEATDKSQLGTIFALTFVLCGSAYALIGVIDAWYFGGGIYESANLNWNVYHGGTGQWTVLDDNSGEGRWTNVALWAKALSFFVQTFPALDVISTFPLNAYVLGNNLRDLVHREHRQQDGDAAPHEVTTTRKTTTFYRAVAAIPPLIGALFVRNLGTITDYSGLSGIAIAFCFPPLLYIFSERRANELGIKAARTQYQRVGSSKTTAWAMFGFGCVAIVFCGTLLVIQG